MAESNLHSCQSHRDQLIHLRLEGKQIPGPLADHLAACESCRAFSAAINGLQPAFAGLDLYTPGLKYRTLQRLEGQAESMNRGFLSVMVLLGLLSLLLWFAIPLLVLTRLLDYWLVRPGFSLLLSLLLLTSLGFLISCLAFLALAHGKGAEHLRGRMNDLLEGFHG